MVRNYTTTLKDAVPLITTYEGLKSQFDWLRDGGISRLVESNLGRQIKQLEIFLRYQSFCLKILKTISSLLFLIIPLFSFPYYFFPSRIMDPDPDFLPIPYPGVKNAADPGSGSTTLDARVSLNSSP